VLERAGLGTALDVWLAELLADALSDYRMLRAEPKHAAFAISAWKRLAKLLTESGAYAQGPRGTHRGAAAGRRGGRL